MNSIKEYVAKQKQLLKEEIEKNNLKPVLAIVQVGDDPASNSYVKGKLKDCEELGITSKHIKLESNISQEAFNDGLVALGVHPKIDGTIVQLPVPKYLIVNNYLIDPRKDVDGFREGSKYTPCTPLGIKMYL
jgi:methylenetetrahydrofolate dehydrogenase (NADP+)/methenyltetrahydrofolate cyclohydrolase